MTWRRNDAGRTAKDYPRWLTTSPAAALQAPG